MIFGGGGGIIEHKMCVLIFPTTFVWNIYHPTKNSARYYKKKKSDKQKVENYRGISLLSAHYKHTVKL